MTIGHWFTNGRYLMNAGVSGAFTWNSSASTTNYAIYAMLVNSATYIPDPRDTTAGVAGYNGVIPNAAEPLKSTGYLRVPVPLANIQTYHKDNPDSDYIIYPSSATGVNWTVSAGTITADTVLFYWDLNIKNHVETGLVVGGSYHLDDVTGAGYDSTSQLIGYASIVDNLTGLSSWTAPDAIISSFDSSSGYYQVLASQVR